jgi:2,4-diketo-3-deoxy-L-fuconate hydrolase
MRQIKINNELMKLIRFGEPGKEQPGVLLDGRRHDAAAFGEDYTEDFFATDGISRLREWVESHKATLPPVDEAARWASPVVRPSKIVCVGLNYADHAAETKAEIPKEPILFFKSTTALCGPNDPVLIPRGSTKLDWEVELAVIIGKKTSYVSEAEALDYVAGYALHNDYSERAFQIERGGQWVKGKSCDTFAPLGPWLATPDELSDIRQLRLWLTVNGKSFQDGNTRNMIFHVSFLIHYISQFMTLLPGDIISTGTPAGVGLGFNPAIYLKEGDVVELGIDGLGTSSQVVTRP